MEDQIEDEGDGWPDAFQEQDEQDAEGYAGAVELVYGDWRP